MSKKTLDKPQKELYNTKCIQDENRKAVIYCMKHLNFGMVDEEFVKRVKVDAAMKGVALKDYLKTAVEFYLEHNETMQPKEKQKK